MLVILGFCPHLLLPCPQASRGDYGDDAIANEKVGCAKAIEEARAAISMAEDDEKRKALELELETALRNETARQAKVSAELARREAAASQAEAEAAAGKEVSALLCSR